MSIMLLLNNFIQNFIFAQRVIAKDKSGIKFL